MASTFDFECEKCGKPYTSICINPEDVDVWSVESNFNVAKGGGLMNTVICAKCHNKFSMYDYVKGKGNWGETYLEINQKITNPDYETIPVTLCRECEKKVIQFIFSSEEVKENAVESD